MQCSQQVLDINFFLPCRLAGSPSSAPFRVVLCWHIFNVVTSKMTNCDLESLHFLRVSRIRAPKEQRERRPQPTARTERTVSTAHCPTMAVTCGRSLASLTALPALVYRLDPREQGACCISEGGLRTYGHVFYGVVVEQLVQCATSANVLKMHSMHL